VDEVTGVRDQGSGVSSGRVAAGAFAKNFQQLTADG
jgi:hypothetical protein